MARKLNLDERKAYEKWQQKCKDIAAATLVSTKGETKEQKDRRKYRAKTDYAYFVDYYFPHYAKAPSATFHIEAADAILADPDILAILEWPREHAKSVHADVILPMWLKIHGELDGMVLVGENEKKAKKLLGDLQAEFEANQKYIADYGEQFSFGDWLEGDFTTKDGINFISLGRGQSPRGIRNQEKRPNYCVIDDIDDLKLNKNERRTREVVDWILSSLLGALSIKGARMVVANNRIHRKSVLAHLVGDLEPGMPKREGIWHSKVCAIEKDGKLAWPENYTKEEIEKRSRKMGYIRAQREFYHNSIVEGTVFKNEWIEWRPRIKNFDAQVIYFDPSFKATSKNDYKAIRHWVKKGQYLQCVKSFVRQTSIVTTVKWLYDYYEELYPSLRNSSMGLIPEQSVDIYIEANFIQDMFLDDFVKEGLERGFQLPIRPDRRSKPDKYSRIENLSPFYERGMVSYAEEEKGSRDMQTGIEQLLAIEPGSNSHDDAPDADEGAIWKLQSIGRQRQTKRIVGERTQRGW